MIDTIHIDLPFQNLPDLHRRSDTIDTETKQIIFSTGYIDCIKVRKINSVCRIECSLSKLLKGNNIYSLDYNEVLVALQLIEQKLGISIKEGIIRRIDFEVTIETKYKPRDYFRYLGNCNYFVRSESGRTTLYYKNRSRQKYIYDKLAEIKSKGGIIPIEYINKNIFRFECRYQNTFIKALAIKFGYENLKVKNLIEKDLYIKFVRQISEEYETIHKINIPIFDEINVSSKIKFFQHLAYMTIEAVGANKIFEMIDATKTIHSKVPSEYYSRRKYEVRELTKQSAKGSPNPIEEINNRIESKIGKII